MKEESASYHGAQKTKKAYIPKSPLRIHALQIGEEDLRDCTSTWFRIPRSYDSGKSDRKK